jgi:hypothetical protein
MHRLSEVEDGRLDACFTLRCNDEDANYLPIDCSSPLPYSDRAYVVSPYFFHCNPNLAGR